MGWTKRQYIVEAYTELGLSDYAVNLTPEELQTALRRLDSMMAEWEADGIRCAYPMAGTPGASNIDTVTECPEAANTAITTNLARQLSAGYGKTVSQETVAASKKSKASLRKLLSVIPEMQFPSTLPRGAGQKAWRAPASPFFPAPTSTDLSDDIDF